MQITIVEKININSSCIADNWIQTGDYSEIADLLSEINELAHAMEESSNSQDEISHYFKVLFLCKHYDNIDCWKDNYIT